MQIDPNKISFDIETTGLDPDSDVILEFAAVHIATGLTFERKIRYERVSITPEAMRVNKIDVSTLDAEDRTPMSNADREFALWLRDTLKLKQRTVHLVGKNVGQFDADFVKHHMPRTHGMLSYRAFDLNTAYEQTDSLLGFEPGLTKSLLRHLAPNNAAHTALGDAIEAAEHYKWLQDGAKLKSEKEFVLHGSY